MIGAVVAAVLLPTAPGELVLPDLEPVPQQGCVVPVSTLVTPCPRPDPGPLVSCVLPVAGFPGVRPRVEPACPDRVPAPRGRTVPVTR